MGWKKSEDCSRRKMRFQTVSKEEIIRKYLELEKENDKLKKEKEALERELRKYKNPNTPPSAHPFLRPVVRPARQRRRGAPQGHPGTTRPWQGPHEVRHILSKECPHCHSTGVDV